MVHQDTQFLDHLPVAENIALPMMLDGMPYRTATDTAILWLERMGLRALATHRPGEMSGGQMQRIVDVFGRKLQPLLIPIKEDLGWVNLQGYVAKPEGAKKVRGEQFFFVNGRYFKSAYLSKAVQEAFDGLLQPGYIPSFFL